MPTPNKLINPTMKKPQKHECRHKGKEGRKGNKQNLHKLTKHLVKAPPISLRKYAATRHSPMSE